MQEKLGESSENEKQSPSGKDQHVDSDSQQAEQTEAVQGSH